MEIKWRSLAILVPLVFELPSCAPPCMGGHLDNEAIATTTGSSVDDVTLTWYTDVKPGQTKHEQSVTVNQKKYFPVDPPMDIKTWEPMQSDGVIIKQENVYLYGGQNFQGSSEPNNRVNSCVINDQAVHIGYK